MEKKYYKYGLRPVYSEENPKGVVRFYAFQWELGEFKEDFSYRRKIYHDISGDLEELSEADFKDYVNTIKKERGLL